MKNKLAGSQSPYLIQHDDNPVAWYPWSPEAFEQARKHDKPIFLSIGYSTCHWCHVMAHESFEDEEVAGLMNDAFVSIKVDREERPDVDGVYMTVCQMMTGQGGWPLTIVMTPEKKPFYAATYIPRESRYGRLGMLDLVPRIKEVWENQRQDVLDSAEQITSVLRRPAPTTADEAVPGLQHLAQAFGELKSRYDPVYGGFGAAPKFPSPSNLLFLLRFWKRTSDPSALEMVVTTLEKMRLGGIHDHLGFGFHRYSTDRHWLLPHFEKMLYDQAMLALAYTEAAQATSRADFRATVEEVMTYVMRDLRSPEGAFYSAEDADSEGREGKFYVWTVDEVRSVLPDDDADLVIQVYNLTPAGNFEEEATRSRTGENVLFLDGQPEPESRERLERARAILFEHRATRIRPGLDDKVLTDWNGLMIAALARASAAFDRADYASAASRAANFILEKLVDDHGRLLHRYRNGEAGIDGNLDDYAYFIWGLVELYEATFEAGFLKAAVDLTEHLLHHFWDREGGGLFFTADDAEALLARRKEFFDGALPSGNAVAMLNLLRLNRMTANVEYQQRADAIASAASVERMPSGFTALLAALDFAIGPTKEVVLAGSRESDDTRRLIQAVRETFIPNKVVLLHDNGALEDLAPFVAGQEPVDGRAAAYVCHDFRCETPVTSADELRALLSTDQS